MDVITRSTCIYLYSDEDEDLARAIAASYVHICIRISPHTHIYSKGYICLDGCVTRSTCIYLYSDEDEDLARAIAASLNEKEQPKPKPKTTSVCR